jgi:hypothetical protein
VAVGGGFLVSNLSDDEAVITSSYPSADNIWTATATVQDTSGDTSFSLQAYVICIDDPTP